MAVPAKWRDWPGLYGRLWAVEMDAAFNTLPPSPVFAPGATEPPDREKDLPAGDSNHAGG